MQPYESLEAHFTRIFHLSHAKAMISWDEATMMPVGGGAARGEAHATIDVLMHEMVTDPRVSDWLAGIDERRLDRWQQANIREIRKWHEKASCLPGDLVEAQARATSACEQAWRSARASNDWDGLRPKLETVFSLARREAEIRSAVSNLPLYDAMLDIYEPGMSSQRLTEEFGYLKSFLPDFIQSVIESQKSHPALPLEGPFSDEQQKQLGLKMMETLGFNFNKGRLDVSHHPFCGGVPDDVRITTRYRNDSFLESMMATLHETGHALYEQGLPVDWRTQPVGDALSFATHESQSLLMEMQACRSPEFARFVTPVIQSICGAGRSEDTAWQSDNVYRLLTHVETGYIRVDADEVTYPMHVIMRFEIEKAIIEGDLLLEDLPDVWNEKMQAYFGLDTSGNFKDGCLQDVHWPAGLIGYFPTYTLGAMTAAQLFHSAREQNPHLMQQIEKGDFSQLVAWLRTHVHEKGRSHTFDELLTSATGSSLDVSYFVNHLKTRYLSDA